jgi:hypothetical protein
MKKIVLGLVFVLINFNITLDNVIINLIPSFIGYYFIMNACVLLADKTSNDHYLEARKHALLLFVITLFTFVLDLIGLSAISPVFSIAVGLLNLVLSLIFLNHLTQSITQTSQFNLSEAWIQQLNSLFRWIAILSVLSYVLMITPLIALVVVIILIVFNVRYILMIHTLNQSLDLEYL